MRSPHRARSACASHTWILRPLTRPLAAVIVGKRRHHDHTHARAMLDNCAMRRRFVEEAARAPSLYRSVPYEMEMLAFSALVLCGMRSSRAAILSLSWSGGGWDGPEE